MHRPPDPDRAFARWARLGVLFGATPARRSPDLERLLLDTARLAPGHARLFYLPVAWLSRYGNFVARHRLKRLAQAELDPVDQPALGALLALAVKHGASRELLIAAEACRPAESPRPLFEVQRRPAALVRLARQQACAQGRHWNLWLPDEPPKLDALRPAGWILQRNPDYRERIVRKGDLRASILLTLRHDAPGSEVASEVALAELCAASRLAVRHALDDLEREGHVLRRPEAGVRNIRIALEIATETGTAFKTSA